MPSRSNSFCRQGDRGWPAKPPSFPLNEPARHEDPQTSIHRSPGQSGPIAQLPRRGRSAPRAKGVEQEEDGSDSQQSIPVHDPNSAFPLK